MALLVEGDVTSLSLHANHTPEAMTRSARAWVCVIATRNLMTGLLAVVLPGLFSAFVFVPVVNRVPMLVWSGFMVVAGVLCLTGAVLRSADWSRIGILFSVLVSTALTIGITFGYVAAWVQWEVGLLQRPPSPFWLIILASLTAKDIIVGTSPMRLPFEAVARRIIAE